MEYLKSKNRVLLQCITFIVITAFLCENIAWAGDYRQCEFNPAQSKLAANSLFKLIEKYSEDKSQRALLIKAIKAEALDGFLKDPETKENVFKKGKFPKVPREIGKTLNGFFEVIGEPKIEVDTASLQVRLDGNSAAMYLFRNPSEIQINPDIGIRNEDDLAIARARGYWFKIDLEIRKGIIDNVSCGTVCESGHEGSYMALDIPIKFLPFDLRCADSFLNQYSRLSLGFKLEVK